jgi:DNA invertase Pin-like site-specific DNA recombinase
MADGKFIAYYRVSTERQGASGLGLDAQRDAVSTYLNGGNWELLEEFTEVESGKRHENRPQLAAALLACKRQKATLVIAKLDRLARNVAFIATILEAGVEVVAADMPAANKMMLQMLAVFAEHEREQISQRTKAALAAKKARGEPLGNRVNLAEAQAKGSMATKRAAEAFAANVLPIIEKIRVSGTASYNGIAAELNARGIKTARGGLWAAATVRNVMLRAPAPELAHAA